MKKGYLYIVLATFFFSTMEIALKLSAGSFNAIQLTFLRFFIGGAVLIPLALRETKQKKTVFRPGDFAFFVLTGFICVVVSMILFQLGIVYSLASVAAVLFSCNSVFVVLFAFLLLSEHIYKHTVLSIVVSIAGMMVIIDPLHMKGSALGVILSLGAAITFALYNVVGRTRSDRFGGITLTCISFLFGCAEMLLLIAVSHIPAVALWCRGAGLPMFSAVPILAGIGRGSLPGLIYVGIFVTGLGYTFYFLAMENTSAATASLVFYIKPVLAPVFSLFILGEAITGRMAAGIALIIVGSLIAFIPGIRLKKGNDLKED
ncbi:MAG: DMT family transporter, partial [Oscillospiraceae bacterium]|nr:DMT family transporter [Oscillospiraceae bacterium]